MYKSETPVGYIENKDFDKLWNDIKPLLLRYVNLDREEPFTEGVSAIIEYKVDPMDLEEVLYGLLISYKNQFAMGYQILQSVTGMFRNHDA